MTNDHIKHDGMRLLGRSDLKGMGINFSNVHLIRLENEGKFPRRLYLSPARVAWVDVEIRQYLAKCISARAIGRI